MFSPQEAAAHQSLIAHGTASKAMFCLKEGTGSTGDVVGDIRVSTGATQHLGDFQKRPEWRGLCMLTM